MTAAAEAARTTARILLEIEAVHFRPRQPFTLTSGRASPVYIDCRKIISFPRARTKIIDLAVELIEREIGFESLDAVAGGETAGIPFAAWIADRLSLPMLYVRKKPKGFGRGAQIEGAMKPGCRCLLVEDLATDGGSKVNFVNAIRDGRGPGDGRLRRLPLRHLPAERGDAGASSACACTASPPGATCWRWRRRLGLLSAADAKDVRAFLDDPEGWSAAHGGKVVA